MNKDTQAFASESGDVCAVWDLVFSEPKCRDETGRCSYPQDDGSYRDGTITFTVETRQARFRTDRGVVSVGARGQLSVPGDQFYETTVVAVVPSGDLDQIDCIAQKRFNPRYEKP